MDIRWTVGVSYITGNKKLFTQYKINARNKTLAESLVKELFSMEYGVNSDISLDIRPVSLDTEDTRIMLRVKEGIFKGLYEDFVGKTYREFVLSFQKFEGFNAHLSVFEDSYFWFKFLGLTVKAVFKLSGECYIDTKEVYFTTELGRKIVAVNDWTEFYYCV